MKTASPRKETSRYLDSSHFTTTGSVHAFKALIQIMMVVSVLLDSGRDVYMWEVS